MSKVNVGLGSKYLFGWYQYFICHFPVFYAFAAISPKWRHLESLDVMFSLSTKVLILCFIAEVQLLFNFQNLIESFKMFLKYYRSQWLEHGLNYETLASSAVTKEILTVILKPIQNGPFRCCSRIGRGAKVFPSLKSVTHILQW